MSNKFSEYLALIPRGIPNIEKILEGTINNVALKYGLLNEEDRQVIVARRIICETCPLFSENAYKSEEYKALYGTYYVSDRADKHCSICGCPEEVRTASLESNCGLEYWNEKHPENKQQLRWKAKTK